jgi:hypothetical protein
VNLGKNRWNFFEIILDIDFFVRIIESNGWMIDGENHWRIIEFHTSKSVNRIGISVSFTDAHIRDKEIKTESTECDDKLRLHEINLLH